MLHVGQKWIVKKTFHYDYVPFFEKEILTILAYPFSINSATDAVGVSGNYHQYKHSCGDKCKYGYGFYIPLTMMRKYCSPLTSYKEMFTNPDFEV